MADTKFLKTGALLFLSSFIIGYGGLAVTEFLYFKTENDFWLWSGSGLYGFSWILFGIGILLSGKEGLTWLKIRFKKIIQ
ncbi:MAG: hypothetical protein QGH24_00515 [Candidatus Marinimicrobia bacterium]|jgi:hypothetical protein|nr:hypothetical protein [Candidatus Neomarinimicrobiota bacterium]